MPRLDSSHTSGMNSGMNAAKVAISMEARLLDKLDCLVARNLFASRSEAIQVAVREKLARLERTRLARECAKLSPTQEQRMADEGLRSDLWQWPEY